MRTGIILQARMGSTRLPGKVLRPLGGPSILEWIVRRLRTCRACGPVIVATTELIGDDIIVEAANTLAAPVFRGSDGDVLDRYRRCADAHDLDVIVRATADNPFVDPAEADALLEFHLGGGFDYSVSTGLPVGAAVEIFSREALQRSWREGTLDHHREHVNEYILENPALFAIGTLPSPPGKQASWLQLTVDTPEDLRHAARLAAATGNDPLVAVEDIIRAATRTETAIEP